MKNRGPNRSKAHKEWARKRMTRPSHHAAYGRGRMLMIGLIASACYPTPK